MIIRVKVIPGSNEELVEYVGDGGYKVKLREQPEKGKANKRLIEMLAEKFGVDKKDVVIKNPTSRKKIVEIVGK